MRVGVTGHQDIPDEAWDEIRPAMSRELSAMGPRPIGISSLAAGADQLFAQTLLALGGRLHVVVPCKGYESTFSTPRDLARFKELVARATKIYPPRFARPSEKAFRAAGRRVVRLSEVIIAAWDGEAARGKGGTADTVRYARRRKKPVRNVWPEGVDRR